MIPYHSPVVAAGVEMPGLLVAVPAYRESGRLPKFLESLSSSLEARFPAARILVVDDGSGAVERERLCVAIERIRASHPSILPPLLLDANIGKGGAILAAWKHHPGFAYLAFVDADGAVSADEVCRVAGLLGPDGNGPALFGSRVKMLGKRVFRRFSRHLSGRIFALFVSLLIDDGIYDSQCGLKFVPASAHGKIEPHLKGHRFAFDVELLAALNKVGCGIQEVPIDWMDMPGSKVSLVRDTLRMLRAVFQIKREMKSWTF